MTRFRLVAADGRAPGPELYDSLFDADEHRDCPANECIRGYCRIERIDDELPKEAIPA